MAGLSGDEWFVVRRAVARYKDAVKSLGEISDNRVTYFEESPTKSAECQKRWKELNDSGSALTAMLEKLK